MSFPNPVLPTSHESEKASFRITFRTKMKEGEFTPKHDYIRKMKGVKVRGNVVTVTNGYIVRKWFRNPRNNKKSLEIIHFMSESGQPFGWNPYTNNFVEKFEIL